MSFPCARFLLGLAVVIKIKNVQKLFKSASIAGVLCIMTQVHVRFYSSG